jgi:S-adenosyl-L-methionine hydrolase (adenosine-forming)
MRNAIVTLLTDFGTKDHYVASMKGVILSINPQCTLVDITHLISPHHIKEGAFVLNNAFSSFPKGTIHLSVVDPGVGGRRKPLLFVTSNYFFVGPDNGLFTLVLRREKVKKVVALTNPDFFLSEVSTTFHGRDLFAPVAAYLSRGVKPERFGNTVDVWEEIPFQEPVTKEKSMVGEIFHVDTFGNMISNIEGERLLRFTRGRPFAVRLGKQAILGLKKGYWEGRRHEPIALIGSGGFLEVSVKEDNAQKVLNAKEGDKIQIMLSTK